MVCIQLLSKSCEKTGCHGYSEVFNRNCRSSPVSGKFRVWNVKQVTEELREKSHEESRIRQLGFDQLYIWTAGLYNNSRSWTGDENSKPGTKMFHEWREMPRSTEKCEEEKYVIIKIGVSKPQLWKRLSATFVRNHRHQGTTKWGFYLKIRSFCLEVCRAIQIPRPLWQGQDGASPGIQGHKGTTDHEDWNPEFTTRALGKEMEGMQLRQRQGWKNSALWSWWKQAIETE